MKTSKSPLAVVRTAHRVASEALPSYSHPRSPQKFTQSQLFACLALKSSMKLDYRGVWQLLLDASDLRVAIGLKSVPHWTTLQKASDRLLKKSPPTSFSMRSLARPVRSGC